MNPSVMLRSVSGRGFGACLIAAFGFGLGSFPRSALTASPAFAGLAPQRPVAVSVESLSDAEVDAALESIWLKSSRDGVRRPETARRGALDAYVRGQTTGARLVSRDEAGKLDDTAGTSATIQQSSFHSEVLPGKVGYLRIAGFEPDTEERLDRALLDFRQLDVNRLVLDLRSSSAKGELAQAGRLSARFLPKGIELFTVREVDAGSDRKVCTELEGGNAPRRLWVLTSRLTAGPAEVLAACLKVHANAMLVGEPTRGEPSEYQFFELNDRVSLRLPVRDPVFTSCGPIFDGGLPPDVPVRVSLQETLDILRVEANASSLSALIREPEYPRMNEQALVSGDNPELESQIRAALEPSRELSRVRDAVLQCALDAIQAMDSLNAGNVAGR